MCVHSNVFLGILTEYKHDQFLVTGQIYDILNERNVFFLDKCEKMYNETKLVRYATCSEPEYDDLVYVMYQ